MPRSFLDHEAKWFSDGTLTEPPDIDGRPEDFRVIGWALDEALSGADTVALTWIALLAFVRCRRESTSSPRRSRRMPRSTASMRGSGRRRP